MANAAEASSLAATMPTTFPRASTNAPPELPGCTVAVCNGGRPQGPSAAPASDAISPVVAVRQHLGRKPLQPDVRETHRGHRPAQFYRAAGGNGQRSTIKQNEISRQHDDAIKPTIIRQIIVSICHGITGRCKGTAQVVPICHIQI